MNEARSGQCGCKSDDLENQTPAAPVTSGEWISLYRIPKMDCPSEERMIRMALDGCAQIGGLSLYAVAHGTRMQVRAAHVAGVLQLILALGVLVEVGRHGGAHMKASWIFSANDVIINLGVIVAGVLVAWTGSNYPDLVIGTIVGLIVLNGARRILALKS